MRNQRVNEKDKAKYHQSYINLYNRLVKEFTPKVEQTIRHEVSLFLNAYEVHNHLTPDVIPSKPIRLALKRLYIVAGLTNATKVLRSIKGQIKGVSRDDKWTWVIAEYLKKNGLDKVSIDITETLKDKIKAEIVKGKLNGWGVDKIVRHIKDDEFPKWMAKRIVRTELNKAANIGAMIAAADLDIEVDKQWLSTIDNRTRRIPRDAYDHLEMNGVQVGFGERFIVPSTKSIDAMLFPGDPDASVGNVVNCRCTLIFVPKRDHEGNVVSSQSGKPSDTTTGELVSSGGGVAVMNQATTNVFTQLLREAASIEITQIIINNILTNEENDK